MSLTDSCSSGYNVYCDESCHLEHDGQPFMVLGGLWCPTDRARDVAVTLREIRIRHGISPHFEIKWVKVSPAKIDFYADVLNFFFDESCLRFRCIIADKAGLQHDAFDQDHDDWYFKMYYQLLRRLVLERQTRYRVYLDIKDTKSSQKTKTLHNVLCNQMHDYDHEALEWVQALRSQEVQQIQLVDLLLGAVSYAARNLNQSSAKRQLIDLIKKRTGRSSVTDTTWYSERKFNVFRWTPQQANV